MLTTFAVVAGVLFSVSSLFALALCRAASLADRAAERAHQQHSLQHRKAA